MYKITKIIELMYNTRISSSEGLVEQILKASEILGLAPSLSEISEIISIVKGNRNSFTVNNYCNSCHGVCFNTVYNTPYSNCYENRENKNINTATMQYLMDLYSKGKISKEVFLDMINPDNGSNGGITCRIGVKQNNQNNKEQNNQNNKTNTVSIASYLLQNMGR